MRFHVLNVTYFVQGRRCRIQRTSEHDLRQSCSAFDPTAGTERLPPSPQPRSGFPPQQTGTIQFGPDVLKKSLFE